MTDTNHQTGREGDDFQTALTAMQRAADVARQRARRGRGTLVVWRDGRIVEESVEEPAAADTGLPAANKARNP